MATTFTVLTPENVRLYVDQTVGPDQTLRLAFSLTHRRDEIAYLTPKDALALRDFLISFCEHSGVLQTIEWERTRRYPGDIP